MCCIKKLHLPFCLQNLYKTGNKGAGVKRGKRNEHTKHDKAPDTQQTGL